FAAQNDVPVGLLAGMIALDFSQQRIGESQADALVDTYACQGSQLLRGPTRTKRQVGQARRRIALLDHELESVRALLLLAQQCAPRASRSRPEGLLDDTLKAVEDRFQQGRPADTKQLAQRRDVALRQPPIDTHRLRFTTFPVRHSGVTHTESF